MHSGSNAEQHYRYDAMRRRFCELEISGPADTPSTSITSGRRYIYNAAWGTLSERTFDASTTLGSAANSLERAYICGLSIDEHEFAMIDGDGDRALTTSKNASGGTEFEYYFLCDRLGSTMSLSNADDDQEALKSIRFTV